MSEGLKQTIEGSNKEISERIEATVDFAYVNKVINFAIEQTKDPNAVRHMLLDPANMRMAIGMVSKQRDGTHRWLSTVAMESLAQDLEAATLRYEGEKDALKKSATNVSDYSKVFDELKTAYSEAEKHLSSLTAKDDLTQEKIGQFLENAGKKNELLIDLASLCVQAEGDGLQYSDLLQKIKDRINGAGDVSGALNASLLADTKAALKSVAGELINANKAPRDAFLQFLVTQAVLKPQGELQTKLENDERAITTKLTELDTEKLRLLTREFEATAQFYDQLAGSNIPKIIKYSLNKEGKFDLERLVAQLNALGKTTDNTKNDKIIDLINNLSIKKDVTDTDREDLEEEQAKNLLKKMLREGIQSVKTDKIVASNDKWKEKSDEQIASSLMKLWDTAPLNILFESEFGLKNPVGVSIPQLYLRSVVPTAVVHDLEGRGIADQVSVHSLANIATFESLALGKLGDTNAQKLLAATLSNEENGRATIDKDSFIELCALLFYESNNREGFNNVKKDAETDIWTPLTSPTGPIKETGGKFSLAISYKNKIIDSLKDKDVKLKAQEIVKTLQNSPMKSASAISVIGAVAQESMRLGRVAVGGVAERLIDFTKIFSSSSDARLLEILHEEQALTGVKGSIEKLKTVGADSQNSMEGAIQKLQTAESVRDANRRPLLPAGSVYENTTQATLMLETLLSVQNALKQHTDWSGATRQRRETAVWIAMNTAEGDGLNKAKEYLEHPEEFEKNENNTKIMQSAAEYRARIRNAEVDGMQDTVKEMEYRLGIAIDPRAIRKFSAINGPDASPLSTGPGGLENILSHPENAEPLLREVLIETRSNGMREALIQAYVTGKDTEDKAGNTITTADAHRYISAVVEHLESQMQDMALSTGQLMRESRHADPLEYVRSAKDKVVEMLQSGDIVQQGIAVGMILAVGYMIKKAWEKNGFWKKVMLFGVPLIGINIVMKKMTGQGIVDRLGMHYMTPEDRNSAIEQFVRRSEKREGYEKIGSPTGYAAIKQFMDPKNPIAIEDLLKWRQSVKTRMAGSNPDVINYGHGAPEGIRTWPIIEAMGDLRERREGIDALKNEAYRHAFLAFEALCIDIAERNDEPEPKAQNGADLIMRRWVNFTEEGVQAYAPGLIAMRSSKEHGFISALDVLVYERGTKASKKFLEEKTITEMAADNVGRVGEWIKGAAARGLLKGQMNAMAGMEAAPILYDQATQLAGSAYDWTADTWQTLSTKIAVNANDELNAAWKILKATIEKTKIYAPLLAKNAARISLDVATSAAMTSAYLAYAAVWKTGLANEYLPSLRTGLERAFGADFVNSLPGGRIAPKDNPDFDKNISQEVKNKVENIVASLSAKDVAVKNLASNDVFSKSDYKLSLDPLSKQLDELITSDKNGGERSARQNEVMQALIDKCAVHLLIGYKKVLTIGKLDKIPSIVEQSIIDLMRKIQTPPRPLVDQASFLLEAVHYKGNVPAEYGKYTEFLHANGIWQTPDTKEHKVSDSDNNAQERFEKPDFYNGIIKNNPLPEQHLQLLSNKNKLDDLKPEIEKKL